MRRIKHYYPLFILLLVNGFLFIFRLGRDMLWDWDECLYGQYAKEMLRTGHYLTNIWNGYIDLQKPPLFSWLLLTPTLFMNSEFGLRLVNVIMSLGLLSSVYLFTQRYFSRMTAVLSSLILLTGEVYVIYSMKLSTDMTYSLLLFLGVWGWVARKRSSVWLAGTFFGLAVMTKGIGVVQFLGALLIAIFLNFDKRRLWDFVKMSGVIALIALPWHVATYLQYGSHFFKVYILDNIIKRSKYPIEFHRERVWFYPLLMYRELMPWLLAVVIFPLKVMLNLFQHPNEILKRVQNDIRKNELIFTILLLILIPLIGITRVQTRIAWYILPLYPFIAIYLGYCFTLAIDAVSDHFPKKLHYRIRYTVYGILMISIIFDAGKLIVGEAKFTQSQQILDTRQEVELAIRRQPGASLTYLVPFGERQAKVILPPEETIDMTWVYGGNGCMVYYGDKKTDYVYEIDRFEKLLKTQRGLFLISNQDSQYAERKRVLFKNADFILFEN